MEGGQGFIADQASIHKYGVTCGRQHKDAEECTAVRSALAFWTHGQSSGASAQGHQAMRLAGRSTEGMHPGAAHMGAGNREVQGNQRVGATLTRPGRWGRTACQRACQTHGAPQATHALASSQ